MPPIDFNNAKIAGAGAKARKSPKSQKAFVEDQKAQSAPEADAVEDVDQSNFIPAYLSSTENDELNQTELNTEFNTSRPLGGGQTDRISGKGSINRGGQRSARAKQGSSTAKKGKQANLTDREMT